MSERVARGTLKVYLGFAPGVGKTFTMLKDAHDRHAAGVDVVVGLIEDHGRERTRELRAGIPAIPLREVSYRGGSFRELDVDAILARKPTLAIVDELAHSVVHTEGTTGGPEKRWEEVQTLLDAGINVYTTLNIQHLESLNDVVTAITGITQRETIPDRVLRAADEIELVDLTPDELRARLGAGHVYPANRVDAALANYFRIGNLTALRELALLWLADQVDELLEKYRTQKSINTTWPARERIVVAVTGGPETETLLRRGVRIVGRIAGRELLAVHVIQDDGLRASDATALARARTLVEELGGTWHTVVGEDPAKALLDFARSVNASQLVLGVSRSGWLRRLRGPGIGSRVIAAAGNIDVHMVTHQAAHGKREPRARRGAALTRSRRIAGWIAALVGPVVVTALFLSFGPGATSLSLTLLGYITLVVFVALLGGFWPAIIAALVGTALVNWFFTPPVHTLTIYQSENVVALVLFLLVAAGVARVVDLAARRTTEAAAAQAQAALLSELAGGVLREGASVQSLLDSLRETFSQDAVTLASHNPEPTGADVWQAVATSGPACQGPGSATSTIRIDKTHALLLVGAPVSASDQRVLEAYAGRLLGVLAQDELDRARVQAQELAAGNSIRTALLAAVSHDLRTPLAGIKAAVSSLRLPDVEFSAEDEAALLLTIEDSTDRLNTLVTNLLDMSRIQAGEIRLEQAPLEAADVVAGALAALPGDLDISLSIPEDLRLLGDYGLLVRILANLLDNALNHGAGAQVGVSGGRVEDRVELRVIDHGPGIPRTEQDTVFRPFQRLGDAPAGTGIGLGLAVARGLTEGIGGTLEIEETPGGGATMVLALPAADPTHPSERSPS
ncbi:two-component system sensor histidine kinase KdpD [Mycetocola sp. BIGb0189]|uniref:ATP-binding protein n=1 Tax=Mycetocola sp. BIGb0189 TaxID=2940604 RepID=UPI00216AADBA|nr:ATP-binding protein [Mycetocola sp. BIGb0189]MCS4276001.1 two-component system sensor histidine kinase KdpD [Mycetocola sp. BIGb0189]